MMSANRRRGSGDIGGRGRCRVEADYKSVPVPSDGADTSGSTHTRKNVRARVTRQIHISAAIKIDAISHLQAVAPQVSQVVDSYRTVFGRIQLQTEGIHTAVVIGLQRIAGGWQSARLGVTADVQDSVAIFFQVHRSIR